MTECSIATINLYIPSIPMEHLHFLVLGASGMPMVFLLQNISTVLADYLYSIMLDEKAPLEANFVISPSREATHSLFSCEKRTSFLNRYAITVPWRSLRAS